MQKAFRASAVFDGTQWIRNQVVLTNNGFVTAITDELQIPSDCLIEDLGDSILMPGFVDVQVYGAGGRLFSAYPDSSTLKLMEEIFLAEGTVAFQPTIATNSPEVFSKAIEATAQYLNGGTHGVIGLHLEGPWINPVRRGAHIEAFIKEPNLKEVEVLLQQAGKAVTMITLAPERCDEQVLRYLLGTNVVISAGHSDLKYEEAMMAFDMGIPTATHLFNAMSPLHHRAPGLVGAILKHPKVKASIIPDGQHVDFAAVSIASKIMGNRLFAITDAVTETDTGPYPHHRSGPVYESGGVLSGSAISMHKGFINLIKEAGIEATEAHRMCSLYPAELMGISDRFGRIAKGARADFIVLSQEYQFEKVISDRFAGS